MNQSINERRFQAAQDLNLFSASQIREIQNEAKAANYPPLEIAIRKGLLTRDQIEILDIFSNPEDIVPGYRIEGLLGRGGVGSVFKATQLRMDRPVAIKVVRPTRASNELLPKRFEREAKIIGRLKHPNIVSAIDYGIHREQLYLVMEFIDGIDAEKVLIEKKRIPETQVWHIARQVCHALATAHEVSIIHRDIKPGNLIFTHPPAGTVLPNGIPFVKVADFGLARATDAQLDATITMDNAISGTPYYMSPEQIRAETIDHRSDIYSLGASIWHFITGAPPITGASPLEIISNKMQSRDEWLDESPDEMSDHSHRLLKKMCRHDRDERIADYPELIQEIDELIQYQHEALAETEEFDIVDPLLKRKAKVITIRELVDTITDQRYADTDETITHADRQISRTHDDRLLRAICWILGFIVVGLSVTLALPLIDSPNKAGDAAANIEIDDDKRIRYTEFLSSPIYLFDGRNVDPTQRATGTWEPAEGIEGESVLAGLGERTFRCRDKDGNPLQFFAFVCGFRLNLSNQIRIRVANGTDLIWEVDVQKDKATLKGTDELASLPIKKFDDDRNYGYHRFRIESQPDHWRIEVDGQLLGIVDKRENQSEEYNIKLVVAGPGPAHFEQIRFREFDSTR